MKKAFTFIELIFVIVVIGILARFGTNILMTTYTAYAQSSNNNKLLANTELTLNIIANRLQYRIKDSVITRNAPNGAFTSLEGTGVNARVLEWVGYDIDGWLGSAGSTNPTWSGFIDVNNVAATTAVARNFIESPGTDTGNITATITALRANGSGTSLAQSAIFFTGQNSNIQSGYGWGDPNALTLATQNNVAAHRIATVVGQPRQLASIGGTSFAGTDIYENFKFAWTAYALIHKDGDGDGVADHLVLCYDYQPWAGDDTPTNGSQCQLLLQNVDTFKFRGVGDSIMIQICTNDNDALGEGDGGYSVCEETAIF